MKRVPVRSCIATALWCVSLVACDGSAPGPAHPWGPGEVAPPELAGNWPAGTSALTADSYVSIALDKSELVAERLRAELDVVQRPSGSSEKHRAELTTLRASFAARQEQVLVRRGLSQAAIDLWPRLYDNNDRIREYFAAHPELESRRKALIERINRLTRQQAQQTAGRLAP